MNFSAYVQSIQSLYLDALGVQLPAQASLKQSFDCTPKRILILSPHPDDECLMAGYALRAKEEFQAEVLVVPFSYGSNPLRRDERKKELMSALSKLQFKILDPRKNGNEEVTEAELKMAFDTFKPEVVILPHAEDGHPVHKRSSQLGEKVAEAFAHTSKTEIHLLFTEFWQSMPKPAFVIPLNEKQASQMGEALLEHVGEVSRNPYHLTLPAYLMDQLRRGSEMKSTPDQANSAGKAVVPGVFGQVYGHRKI